MRSTVPLIILIVSLTGCWGARPALALAGIARTAADTADVLEAVWRVRATSMTIAGVEWLYLPNADSAALTLSDAVRTALAQRNVPASARRPMGHDTVVYQVLGWTSDASGDPVLTLSSAWTLISKSAPAYCMTGGNKETSRARRGRTGWKAERIGPNLHGNGYCNPNDRRP
ncbi:MAG: hypothetical protein IBJ19_16320 [Gemmatimonadaceae bacterium]|nr:hypothetical protein [Gemmatimonadaceae bacterium]